MTKTFKEALNELTTAAAMMFEAKQEFYGDAWREVDIPTLASVLIYKAHRLRNMARRLQLRSYSEKFVDECRDIVVLVTMIKMRSEE